MKKIFSVFLLFIFFVTNFFGYNVDNAYAVSNCSMQSSNYCMQYDTPLTSSGGSGTTVNYVFSETSGEVSANDTASSASYRLKSGYWGIQVGYISISSPLDAVMAPDIPGMTGGTSNADITWNVISDDSSGFNMKVAVSTAPALKLDAGYYFNDYSPGSAGTPDYNWSVTAGDAEFGFSVEPATADDATQIFKDDGAGNCDTNSNQTTDKCWLNFNGTTDIAVINRAGRTGVTGEDEKIKFRAQSNAKFLKSGQYTSQITVTVAQN